MGDRRTTARRVVDSRNYQPGDIIPPVLAIAAFCASLVFVDGPLVHRITLGFSLVAIVFTLATIHTLRGIGR